MADDYQGEKRRCRLSYRICAARYAAGKDLTGTLIADIVLQLLCLSCGANRRAISIKAGGGIAAAHRRGIRFRRPQKRCRRILRRFTASGRSKISGREAARRLHTHNTFSNDLKLLKTMKKVTKSRLYSRHELY